MIDFCKRAYTHILDIIAPPVCAACRFFLNSNTVLCMVCIQKIQPVVSHTIALTPSQTPSHSMRVLAVGAYGAPLKSLILAKSYGYKPMSIQLGKLVWQQSLICNMPCDVITSVPLHWTRYRWRGYNQAEEIARVIARESETLYVDLLQRTKKTPYLSAITANERSGMMKGALSVHDSIDKSMYKDKHIVLVDDLMTTGSTLQVAGKTLLALKPASITAVVVARSI